MKPLYPAVSAVNVVGNHWRIGFGQGFTNEINFEVEFRHSGAVFNSPDVRCFQACPESTFAAVNKELM